MHKKNREKRNIPKSQRDLSSGNSSARRNKCCTQSITFATRSTFWSKLLSKAHYLSVKHGPVSYESIRSRKIGVQSAVMWRFFSWHGVTIGFNWVQLRLFFFPNRDIRNSGALKKWRKICRITLVFSHFLRANQSLLYLSTFSVHLIPILRCFLRSSRRIESDYDSVQNRYDAPIFTFLLRD